jgi:hypothetical protein
MKFEVPKCPQCGLMPIGIVEDIHSCVAFVTDVEGEDAMFAYEGETKVNWDGQMTRFDKDDGRATLVCGARHEWQSLIDWNPFNAQEDQSLRDMYLKGLPVAEIAEALKRTVEEIETRLEAVGLIVLTGPDDMGPPEPQE